MSMFGGVAQRLKGHGRVQWGHEHLRAISRTIHDTTRPTHTRSFKTLPTAQDGSHSAEEGQVLCTAPHIQRAPQPAHNSMAAQQDVHGEVRTPAPLAAPRTSSIAS